MPKIKSLILFLFPGATVAFAEIYVENDPNGNYRRGNLVSLNSLLSFCFVANFLKQSAYGKFCYQQSELADCFQWCQLSLLMLDSLLKEP